MPLKASWYAVPGEQETFHRSTIFLAHLSRATAILKTHGIDLLARRSELGEATPV